MSLKAGRVGVNPADVDPISGHISPDATDSYTKSQADDKFLSKSDASSTYETKSDAAALQSKTLAVPIEMLSGSKLTVESALQGLNDLTKTVTENFDVTLADTDETKITFYAKKYLDSLVVLRLNMGQAVSGIGSNWIDAGAVVPQDLIPASDRYADMLVGGGTFRIKITSNGHLYYYATTTGNVYLQGTSVYYL